MDNKPSFLVSSGRDRLGVKSAYFLAGGFAFFFTKSVRSLGGMASIRRAISSSGIGVSSDLRARTLFMGVSYGY